MLVLLFVKYVSDKYADQPGAPIEVPPGGRFADMAALKGDKEIGDKINKIIGKLAEANDLKGVIDVADFNDEDKLGKGKEMQDRLSNLVAIFENPALDFSRNRAEGDDLLGDAYEYLMRHFATESGKSKGQFYTPAEVSIVMAKIIGITNAKTQDKTLYDPTCGSGSLLLRAAEWGVKPMKTRWGTCNIDAHRIWLNLELIKKPAICLEYVVVHEMVHLLERHHTNRFAALMDQAMPQWRLHREELNREPLGHVTWEY